ncbi:hypothetical protein C1280_11385 [Gemmata obscuriglobus]|uniref:Uncharacterized protein n=1 Tax=Gemmata obscuriglobus TaxID=114 RepID=A0A2Z3H7A9_9BACT|nr:hypothetical protein C1280_11385 [Gemmata obscuriglobus]
MERTAHPVMAVQVSFMFGNHRVHEGARAAVCVWSAVVNRARRASRGAGWGWRGSSPRACGGCGRVRMGTRWCGSVVLR